MIWQLMYARRAYFPEVIDIEDAEIAMNDVEELTKKYTGIVNVEYMTDQFNVYRRAKRSGTKYELIAVYMIM